jgi:hypothetical protein
MLDIYIKNRKKNIDYYEGVYSSQIGVLITAIYYLSFINCLSKSYFNIKLTYSKINYHINLGNFKNKIYY